MKYITIIFLFLMIIACKKENSNFLECLCMNGNLVPLYKGCNELTCDSTIFECSQIAFLSKIYREIKYPEQARKDSIQGRVEVEFLIDLDGVPSNFRTVNTPIGYGLEEAAIEAAKTLGEVGFYPVYEECEPVEFLFILPVTFKLQ